MTRSLPPTERHRTVEAMRRRLAVVALVVPALLVAAELSTASASAATRKATKKTTKKVVATRKTVAISRSSATGPTTTTVVPTVAPVPTVRAIAAGASPVDVVYGGNLIPDPTTPTTVVAIPGSSTTSTTVPAPSPAGAPSRATATGIEPYRGFGAWADGLDWMACPYASKTGPGKCQTPPFNVAKLDQLAANGVQTLYLQITRTSNPLDIPEPERLYPLIDRAHALGMAVVGWYIPAHLDVNLDLRRAVAIAGLDLDGLTIDIESNAVSDLPSRNARLQSFMSQLRSMLPGRAIGATILAPVFTDDPKTKLWPAFDPSAIAPFVDVWQIMGYFTDYRARTDVPWRDAYLFTRENVARLRQRVGSDKPIHVVGGVADTSTAYDASRFAEAARDAGGIIGGSFYDWMSTKVSVLVPYLWSFRSVPDPRWTPPPFAPPTTSTTTTTTTLPVLPLGPYATAIATR